MSKHTPEPWEFESEPQYCSEIIGSNGDSVCTFVEDPSGVDVDRILSCVNACAGMADPAAEIAELKRQRDELLAALNLARDYVGCLDTGGPALLGLICVIDDAIEETKGPAS